MTLKEIKTVVEYVCGIRIHLKNRAPEYVNARIIYCVLAKENTKYTLEKIGKTIGRDHATVLHGINKFYKKRKCIEGLEDTYVECNEIIFNTDTETYKDKKNKLDVLLNNINSNIIRELVLLNPELLQELYSTRIKPFLNMRKTI